MGIVGAISGKAAQLQLRTVARAYRTVASDTVSKKLQQCELLLCVKGRGEEACQTRLRATAPLVEGGTETCAVDDDSDFLALSLWSLALAMRGTWAMLGCQGRVVVVYNGRGGEGVACSASDSGDRGSIASNQSFLRWRISAAQVAWPPSDIACFKVHVPMGPVLVAATTTKMFSRQTAR